MRYVRIQNLARDSLDIVEKTSFLFTHSVYLYIMILDYFDKAASLK